MILTRDMNPANLMFEGFPDIRIVALNDRQEARNGHIAVYFERPEHLQGGQTWYCGTIHTSLQGVHNKTHANLAYDSDGRAVDYPWPRVVMRKTKPKEVWLVRGETSSGLTEWRFRDAPDGASNDYLSLEEGLLAHSGSIIHYEVQS